MISRMKLRLVCALLTLLSSAPPADAKGSDPCRPIGLAAGQSLVLRNSKPEPVTLSLRFQPEAGASQTTPVACGTLSLKAGQSSDAMALAELCPALRGSTAGVLQACVAASGTSPSLGVPSGELLDDLMGNNLRVGGR